jgi:Flp pilus assembly CpaF family ATPase
MDIMTDKSNTNGHMLSSGRSSSDKDSENRVSSDEKQVSKFLKGRSGTRMISFAAVLEQIISTFLQEHGNDSPALLDSHYEADKLKLVLATVDYVIAVESIEIQSSDKAYIIQQAYAEIFGYGPLDAFLKDEEITTIVIEGYEKLAVRRGHGELLSLESQFEDRAHLQRVLRRILVDAGTDIDAAAIIEVGLHKYGRSISISVVLPPVTLQPNVDIRLHPSKPVTLENLIRQHVLNERDAILLKAIAQSNHGFIITGDTESGKTTLMNLMIGMMDTQNIASVERTGELLIPHDKNQFVVQWGGLTEKARSFSQQIKAALDIAPDMIILDEVRADEPDGIALLLTTQTAPRQAWAVRGTADTKRLAAALNMIVRRSHAENSEELVKELARRLPFIIMLRRTQGNLKLRGIAEWQFDSDNTYASLVELLASGWDGLELTGRHPVNALDLDNSYWE